MKTYHMRLKLERGYYSPKFEKDVWMFMHCCGGRITAPTDILRDYTEVFKAHNIIISLVEGE